MLRIPGGTFTMGCTNEQQDCDSDEKTTRQVTASTFWMAKTELTFEEYDAFCDATGRTKPNDQGWGRGKRPVINVNWDDVVAYCNWRSQKESLTPCYKVYGNTTTCNWRANGYRLPIGRPDKVGGPAFNTWPSCAYSITLTTRRMLTTGEADDQGKTNQVIFCK